MGDDKLTHRQRVRLESFAQALNSAHTVWLTPKTAPNVVALSGEPQRPTMADVFARAEEIEKWLWAVEEADRVYPQRRMPTPGMDPFS